MDDLRLYILMRCDLASLNPGKACAQATHAANQCVADAHRAATARGDNYVLPDLRAWAQDRGFGTCIVLSVTEVEMRRIVAQVVEAGAHSAITHDPSYPLRDGETVHHIPLDTCAYVFGSAPALAPFIDHLGLMP